MSAESNIILPNTGKNSPARFKLSKNPLHGPALPKIPPAPSIGAISAAMCSWLIKVSGIATLFARLQEKELKVVPAGILAGDKFVPLRIVDQRAAAFAKAVLAALGVVAALVKVTTTYGLTEAAWGVGASDGCNVVGASLDGCIVGVFEGRVDGLNEGADVGVSDG